MVSGHYKSTTAGQHYRQVPTLPIHRSNCWDHLDKINKPDFDPDVLPLSKLYELEQFALLRPLFQRIMCVPASSAPVERIFSQSGLIMRPNRSRMSDSMLEMLMILKCNVTDCKKRQKLMTKIN